MGDAILHCFQTIETVFWGYAAFVLISLLGCWLTWNGRFFQIRAFPTILKTFGQALLRSHTDARGIHPLRAFFASVGGMIGIGNVAGVVTAVQIGGPGALFWVWMAAFIGSIIKYSEIFLGLKHRVKNDQGGYDGGPMYFLQRAFPTRVVPILISVLLCIYGVEIYQFKVVTDTLTRNFDLSVPLTVGFLLMMICYASVGGVSRIGSICACVMPIFMAIYVTMSLWIICQNLSILPGLFKTVFISAFTGHAAVGGFAGSTALLALQHGIARAAYSADIGIGYDSIIQSESNVVRPQEQARLAVLGVCTDNLICTMSILVVLVTGMWRIGEAEGAEIVQMAFSQYFPYMHVFMPSFLFILGYTTMIAYFCVGIKCARFLSPRWGFALYLTYGMAAWLFFSCFDQTHALLTMSLAGALLLTINLLGIFLLRKEVVFEEQEERHLWHSGSIMQDSSEELGSAVR